MRHILAIILVFLPAMVLADRVIVRSGDHADFSRLAFEFPDPVVWEMGRTPEGYEIRIDRQNLELDVSGVYRRISRDRISDIKIFQGGARVTLKLGCECYADAFEFRPGLLVVDVKDGPPPNNAGFEVAFNTDETSSASPATAPISNRADERQEQAIENTDISSHVKPILPLLRQEPRQPMDPRVGVFAATPNAGVGIATGNRSTERISEMQSEMMLQIGRAAAQGLLEADVDRPAHSDADRGTPSESEIQTAGPVPPSETNPHINIHIETSVDRELDALRPSNQMTGSGSECISGKLLDVAEWGNPESILESITVQRGAISGEFDKPDEQAVEALVKGYIYAGFGAEARANISAFDVTLKNAGLLIAMAQILDAGAAGPGSRFEGQVGCDTDAALWAVLAAPELSTAMDINQTAVLGAFSSLPFHLRKHLGPNLSQKFLDIGDEGTAHALRNAIARATEDAGPEFSLLDAQLDQQRGLHDAAEQSLKQIVADDSSVAPNALVELLKAKLEQDADIEDALITSAESYFFEQQHTEIGAELKRVIALAQSQSGDLPAALAALREISMLEHIDVSEQEQAWEEVLQDATEKAADESFLQFVFAAQDDLGHQSIARNIRRNASKRLLNLGLPEMAKQVLAAPSDAEVGDRIVLARASMMVGEPEQAIEMLKGVKEQEAIRLMARALEATADYSAAAQQYASISDQKSQSRTVWQSEDWQELNEIGTASEKSAARVMLASQAGLSQKPPETEDGIEEYSALLDASTSERQAIEALLEERRPPDQDGS